MSTDNVGFVPCIHQNIYQNMIHLVCPITCPLQYIFITSGRSYHLFGSSVVVVFVAVVDLIIKHMTISVFDFIKDSKLTLLNQNVIEVA